MNLNELELACRKNWEEKTTLLKLTQELLLNEAIRAKVAKADPSFFRKLNKVDPKVG